MLNKLSKLSILGVLVSTSIVTSSFALNQTSIGGPIKPPPPPAETWTCFTPAAGDGRYCALFNLDGDCGVTDKDIALLVQGFQGNLQYAQDANVVCTSNLGNERIGDGNFNVMDIAAGVDCKARGWAEANCQIVCSKSYDGPADSDAGNLGSDLVAPLDQSIQTALAIAVQQTEQNETDLAAYKKCIRDATKKSNKPATSVSAAVKRCDRLPIRRVND